MQYKESIQKESEDLALPGQFFQSVIHILAIYLQTICRTVSRHGTFIFSLYYV